MFSTALNARPKAPPAEYPFVVSLGYYYLFQYGTNQINTNESKCSQHAGGINLLLGESPAHIWGIFQRL